MKITAGTIVRTVILALALFNQVMSATGHPVIDLENETIETFITTGATVLTAIISWWKNNSFTRAALIGDFHMREVRLNVREKDRLEKYNTK